MDEKPFTLEALRKIWCDEYKRVTGKTYQIHGNVFNENRILKDLRETCSKYQLPLAIMAAIRTGIDTIVQFGERIDEFVSSGDFPELEYAVRTRGGHDEKEKLMEIALLDAEWMPSATTVQRKIQLWKEIKDWTELNGKL